MRSPLGDLRLQGPEEVVRRPQIGFGTAKSGDGLVADKTSKTSSNQSSRKAENVGEQLIWMDVTWLQTCSRSL